MAKKSMRIGNNGTSETSTSTASTKSVADVSMGSAILGTIGGAVTNVVNTAKYTMQKKPQRLTSNSKVNDIQITKIKNMQKAPEIKFSNSDLYKLHKTLNIYDSSFKSALWQWDRNTDYYNRFKTQTLDDVLPRGFGHVFFIRPNCNILSVSGTSLASGSGLSKNQMFAYALKNCPSLLKELCHVSGHTFMLSLSNKATNYAVNEEYLADNTYGKTYTGHQIAYGKNNIESQTANQITIELMDDRYLHAYQLNKLWIEYISGCYRGTIIPTTNTIINKVLDYAGAVYYILTAEDGETILYWEKLYGVFPSNISTDPFSWDKDSLKTIPRISVTYKYSMRKAFDPTIFVEFNHNAGLSSTSNKLVYAPTYDKKLGHTGESWVGLPYIELETENSANANPYTYKLRFRYKAQPSLL